MRLKSILMLLKAKFKQRQKLPANQNKTQVQVGYKLIKIINRLSNSILKNFKKLNYFL